VKVAKVEPKVEAPKEQVSTQHATPSKPVEPATKTTPVIQQPQIEKAPQPKGKPTQATKEKKKDDNCNLI
jgi:hypothetical protein